MTDRTEPGQSAICNLQLRMLDSPPMPASKLQPAVLGGVFIGVLSALPFVSLGNCCCLWVIGGGVLAAWLLQQNQSLPIENGDAALVGLYAGLIGAVVALVVQIPLTLALGPMQEEMIRQWAQRSGEMPEELREVFDNLQTSGGLSAIGLLVGFVFMLVIGAIFSTLGGLLGALFFRRQSPPSVPPLPPPGEAWDSGA